MTEQFEKNGVDKDAIEQAQANPAPAEHFNPESDEMVKDNEFFDSSSVPTKEESLEDAVPYTGGEPVSQDLPTSETVAPYRNGEDGQFYFKMFVSGEEREYGPFKTESIAKSKIKAILEAIK